MKVNTDC